MLKQSLHQSLQQKLSPQQIQLMKLLQVPTTELEQRVKEELESNPALEEGADEEEEKVDDNSEDTDRDEENSREDFDLSEYITDDEVPSYKTRANNTSADDDEKSIPLSMGKSFHEVLMGQLGELRLDENEKVIAEHLVGNFDEAGYLRRDLESICDDLVFYQNISTTVKQLGGLLKKIQNFDPAGVGARDLQECLLIQIKRKNKSTESILLAQVLLTDCFDEITKKHYTKIIKRKDITEEQLKDAVAEILKLNPKPGNSMNETQRTAQTIIPDFILNSQNENLELSLNSRNAPELKISREYTNLMKAYSANKKGANKSQKDAVLFVKQKLDAAKWFIDAIRQRQNTLLTTMQTIINYQKEYFIDGDETKLKPMILKDIADIVKMDISTISRVANSKYIQTHFGTFLLKSFFSESMQNDKGEEISTREIKKILQDAIDSEEKRKPYTDEKLKDVLKERGYLIARRTVAKYREQLKIPVGRLRKEI
ncbi:MAG: RNA polymerase sigma-54 factor [Saprospiraceae bacterium]|jgi:RNA polymerase sigma-54 factor